MEFVNIAAYKFVQLPATDLPEWREAFREKTAALALKGTILLSPEGINMFLAGTAEAINDFKSYMKAYPQFVDLHYKDSLSDYQPFTRMLVKLKKEIIAFGLNEIQPGAHTAPRLAPETLKQWYEEGKEMIVLDTRNDYEIKLGTFENAVDLDLQTFKDFPNVIKELPDEMKKKPVVTFCTGGIRCEKAATLMENEGFEEVYQLDGGILNYFEKCGGDHYEGDCFVFDKRVALNSALTETETIQCYACQNPLTSKEQAEAAGVCPYCHTGLPVAASSSGEDRRVD